MKIGIFCGTIGFGGSQNTTVSLACELQKQGHQVILYIDRRRFRAHKNLSLFKVCDFPINLLSPAIMGFTSLRNMLHCINLLQKQRPDVLLSISTGPLYILLMYNVLTSIPIVYYELGPKMRYIARVFHGIVVANSEETRDLLCKWMKKKPKDITIIQARVDVRDFHYISPSSKKKQLTQVVILMIARLELEKTASVIKVMRAVELLVRQGMNIRLKICGSGRDSNKVISIAKKINDGIDIPVINVIEATSYVGNVIAKSDIVLGVGRCAWEAMACGRPVVVIGQEGIGGVVCKDTVKTLMYYNFTARGGGKGEEPRDIAEVLRPLIRSPSYRKQLGEYGLSIVKQYYDVAIGAKQMEDVFTKARQVSLEKTLTRRLKEFGVITAMWFCLYSKGFMIWFLRPQVAAKSLYKAISLAKLAILFLLYKV